MICELCNGKGWIQGQAPDIPTACPACCGNGFIEQTNEEWFAGLSTKEKAKWMFELTYKCYWCGREYAKTKKYNEKECPFHKCLDDSKGFEEWLKEIHDENT